MGQPLHFLKWFRTGWLGDKWNPSNLKKAVYEPPFPGNAMQVETENRLIHLKSLKLIILNAC